MRIAAEEHQMQSTVAISRSKPVAWAVLLASIIAVTAAGPVAADTELGHKGTVGQHSLRDNAEKGGIFCRYKALSEGPTSFEGKLNRIVVRPPKMRSISTSQRVGWRFIVQRSKDGGAWKRTFRSPIQKARAYSNTNASFSRMSVKVNVPPDGLSDEFIASYSYRVIVKMIWYRPDGTQRGSARHMVNFAHDVLSGRHYGINAFSSNGECGGYIAFVGH
jgi:hypothetical protein